MSARARHLSVLLAILLAVATPLAVAAASGPGNSPSAPAYRVKSGDTITSIAVKLRLAGGWQQLYEANKDQIGTDPNRLEVGTELTVPQGAAVPAGEGYVVRPGDTLNSIAGRMHVAGGGNALYAANRNVIGPDPNRLEVGQTLLPPGAPRTTAAQAPKTSVPPAALNRPAAPAPVAAGPTTPGSSVQAAGSGNGKTVLWSVLAGLLFVALVLLVVLGLPRWRRLSGSAEVWVGGEYSADNQPAEPRKPGLREQLLARFSKPARSEVTPVGHSAATALTDVGGHADLVPTAGAESQRDDELQQAQLPKTEPFEEPQPVDEPKPVRLIDNWSEQQQVQEPEPEPVQLAEPEPEPQQMQLAEPEPDPFDEPESVRVIHDWPGQQQPTQQSQANLSAEPEVDQAADAEPAEPIDEAEPPSPTETEQKERADAHTPQEPLSPRLVRSVVAGLQPGSVGRQSRPRRQRARSLIHAAVSGLRDDRQRRQTPAGEGGLADELLGEVRLVDPSTPLTKDHRQGP